MVRRNVGCCCLVGAAAAGGCAPGARERPTPRQPGRERPQRRDESSCAAYRQYRRSAGHSAAGFAAGRPPVAEAHRASAARHVPGGASEPGHRRREGGQPRRAGEPAFRSGSESAIMPRCASPMGADHAGFEMKRDLAAAMAQQGHEILDVGTHSTAAVDYPDIAEAVATALRNGQVDRGIIVCGSGAGVIGRGQQVPGRSRCRLSRHLHRPAGGRTRRPQRDVPRRPRDWPGACPRCLSRPFSPPRSPPKIATCAASPKSTRSNREYHPRVTPGSSLIVVAAASVRA